MYCFLFEMNIIFKCNTMFITMICYQIIFILHQSQWSYGYIDIYLFILHKLLYNATILTIIYYYNNYCTIYMWQLLL